MGKTSTPLKKSVKKQKPAKKVIDNILNYSASISLIAALSSTPFIVVNN